MRGDLLCQRLGDLAAVSDQLRHGDAETHGAVVRVLGDLTAAERVREGTAASKLVGWLTDGERALLADTGAIDLRYTTASDDTHPPDRERVRAGM